MINKLTFVTIVILKRELYADSVRSLNLVALAVCPLLIDHYGYVVLFLLWMITCYPRSPDSYHGG